MSFSAPQSVVRFVDRFGNQRNSFHGKLLSVDGVLRIGLDGASSLVMNDTHCTGVRGRTMQHWVTPEPAEAGAVSR